MARRIGFLDITDPARPRGLGTLSLERLGDAEDEPTSVTVVGEYVLVVVNTSASHTRPSGRLDVVSLRDRQRVRSFDLGGQPDSIAVSKDKRYAAVAIENERDEEATPPGGEEGDLPQAPAGFVQILDLGRGTAPAHWRTRAVPLTRADGQALPALAEAPLTEPTDPEPEYVSINGRNQLAVTLQENNGVVLIDLPTGRITDAFSAGTATVRGIDTVDDGTIDQSGAIEDLPREARRRRLDRRPLPGHRQRGRLARRHARLDGVRQPHRPTRLGRGQRFRAARRAPRPARRLPGREEGRRAGGHRDRRVRRRALRLRRLGARQLRRGLRRRAGPPGRSSASCCPPPTAPRACCRSRRADCSRSPARRTTPRRACARP
ncbi:hypothetical protein R2F25_01360 [Streptomyces sp. UP1A-1]|nr:hypothetical protein [Streptomyces sp. UP1A-1]